MASAELPLIGRHSYVSYRSQPYMFKERLLEEKTLPTSIKEKETHWPREP